MEDPVGAIRCRWARIITRTQTLATTAGQMTQPTGFAFRPHSPTSVLERLLCGHRDSGSRRGRTVYGARPHLSSENRLWRLWDASKVPGRELRQRGEPGIRPRPLSGASSRLPWAASRRFVFGVADVPAQERSAHQAVDPLYPCRAATALLHGDASIVRAWRTPRGFVPLGAIVPLFIAEQAAPPPNQNGSAPTKAAEGAPPPAQHAAPAQDSGYFGPMFMLVFLVPLFGVMWWTQRSQQKKQESALSDLKKGDRVLTSSGLVGKLIESGDRYAKVEIAPGVKVEVLKSSLLGKDTGANAPEK